MGEEAITGHYALLAAVKRGEYPDGRTRIAKTVGQFRDWLRGECGELTPEQQGREALDIPTMFFFFTCPMLNRETGSLLDDYKWARNSLRELCLDLWKMRDTKNGKAPSLDDYIQTHYGKKK